MCSLQEHIEREIRERERQTAEDQESAGTTPEPTGSFLLPLDRRWNYIGAEIHYGYRYHLWENAATKRRYAWEADAYHRETTKETSCP